MVPFAEKVLFMKLRNKRERANKLEPRFEYGIWAGIERRTGAYIIMTPDGRKLARTVRRLPADRRYDWGFLQSCKGYPWDPDAINEQEVDVPTGENGNRILEPEEQESPAARRMRIDTGGMSISSL